MPTITVDPAMAHELSFDLKISGTKDSPNDIRFIIEAQIDPDTGDSVQDVFSVICKAIRSEDGVKVIIPRLLNLFRSGSYKSRLEVVLENKLFIPFHGEIVVNDPVDNQKTKLTERKMETSPNITVTLKKFTTGSKENSFVPFSEKIQSVDPTWRNIGFKSLRNPFKLQTDPENT